jgi:hypothetical protein
MLVLPCTVASRYYNCCTEDSTSPWNYGYSCHNFSLSYLFILWWSRQDLARSHTTNACLNLGQASSYLGWGTVLFLSHFSKNARIIPQFVHDEFYLSPFQLKKKKTPWPESASELYQLSDCRLSAKLVPTFADRGYHVVSVTSPYGHILGFLHQKTFPVHQ